jgi:hypothetical protein
MGVGEGSIPMHTYTGAEKNEITGTCKKGNRNEKKGAVSIK